LPPKSSAAEIAPLSRKRSASVIRPASGCSSIPGEGVDKQDKGTAKALTGARKYLMRLLFCVPTGDDNEKEAEVGGKVAQTAAKSADFSPFVMGLLGQIEGLQTRKVKNADAAAAKVYDHARAGLSDDDIKESLSKLIDWVADNS
jgi:hypothetical protein